MTKSGNYLNYNIKKITNILMSWHMIKKFFGNKIE